VFSQYGKTDAQMALMAKAYVNVLGGFDTQIVANAFEQWLGSENKMPTPADIKNIIIPPKKRVTEAQLVTATKAQERNGWDPFSDDQDVINEYREQEKQDFANNKKHDELVLPVGHLVKRIGGSYAQK